MDCEREKFRMYVEKSGVMSTLTDALVGLYELPQKPEDAMSYIRDMLGQNTAETHTIAMLKEKVQELEAENKMIKEQLRKYQQSESENALSEQQ